MARRKEDERDDAKRWGRMADDFAEYTGKAGYDRKFAGVVSGSLSAEYGMAERGQYPPEGHDYPNTEGR